MSVWYFNKNLKPQGPVSFEDLKRKISRGEIGPQDLINKEGEARWAVAADWKELPKDLFPAFQKNLFRSISPSEAEWTVLHLKPGATAPVPQGPYSLVQIRTLMSEGKISDEDYIWRTGLSGWLQIKDRPDLFSSPESTPAR